MASKNFLEAEGLFSPHLTLEQAREEAARCTACPLHKHATQTVFGEGPPNARLMLVGEAPGDQEDLAGRPFVGPAGQLLNRCLKDAGIDRTQAYITNAVKHFKFEPRGKRRLHIKPNIVEMQACRPWIQMEIERVQPQVLVCLGATAAQTLLGADFRVTRWRGQLLKSAWAPVVLATVHPASILRTLDADREFETQRLIDDLRKAAQALEERR